MTLKLQQFTLGPLGNNTCVLIDPDTRSAIIVDPAYGADDLVIPLKQQHFHLEKILLTHAHFDHIAGVAGLSNSAIPNIPVYLHPDDLELWNEGGGGAQFGFHIETCDSIQATLTDGQVLHLGDAEIRVYHTPGHTPGHVIFYIPSIRTALVGDLIFREGVGRTDMPYGDGSALIRSIHDKVLTLPEETVLIPGHGPNTTVGYERVHNPFL
jgi:hydroxyacylglutathione hydrolase